MYIDSYSFGSMVADGITYNRDLIIYPDRIKPNWWRKSGHSLIVEDLDGILQYNTEFLIVGQGYSGAMQIPSSTKETIEKHGIDLISGLTGDMVDIFNKYSKKNKNIVGAFHLTC